MRASNILGLLNSIIVVCLMLLGSTVAAQEEPWSGQWITSKGLLELKQTGGDVSGTIGDGGTFDGTVDGNKFKFQLTLGRENGSGKATLSEDGLSFTADVNSNFRQYEMTANKKDENAEGKDPLDFNGIWLSSIGTLNLEQKGTDVTGTIGPEGWSFVENGKVVGSRLEFDYVVRQFKGKAWLQQGADGQTLFGLMDPDKDEKIVWTGARPVGYEANVKPIAGEAVQGVATNGMLYNLRMPDGWSEGDKVDAIVLLHGSNFTTTGMVAVTARNWPDIAKKFAIIGIQGQSWNKHSKLDTPTFNYTYVNWVGRSTLGGFPYTHRESPYLVGVLLDEFKDIYLIERTFVGGHSQGGFLTHVLHMHYPEKITGTFPMAGGVIIQAEPDVFDDEDLMAEQRMTPMYLMHGKKDNVVDPSMSDRAYGRFLAHEFPRVKYHAPGAGHPYDFLPVDKAIQWLDMMTTNDKVALKTFGDKLVSQKKWRDVGMVIERAEAIEGGKDFAKIWSAFEAAAQKSGKSLLKKIEANESNKWVDKYLDWEEKFALSTKCKDVVAAFGALREQHQETADELYQEGRKAFRNDDRKGGYAKYQEIVDKYYASTHYRSLKKVVDKQKKN
jgi:predicted esterase